MATPTLLLQQSKPQEVELMPHDLQNPPSLPYASHSSSAGVPTIVRQGGSSESSNAANNISDADDDQLQRMFPSSVSAQLLSVLREGIKDIITKEAELIVEASITSCAQIDSSKFIRVPLEQLLPRDIKKAEKVRLLITARDKDVYKGYIIKTHVFAMRCLLNTEAMRVLNNER